MSRENTKTKFEADDSGDLNGKGEGNSAQALKGTVKVEREIGQQANGYTVKEIKARAESEKSDK